ncbi:ribosomal-protein-alanine N-acetyltransferase [Rhodoligotrophos appendicifer]|uniref:GNAT family N-acetyltransferase n=1 Tax=Rhodoligotrophos appendicifer TaxID=987056 RepID=UPI001184A66F|nr:GNAT family protein [Rhodoligotrophos appendicifer]
MAFLRSVSPSDLGPVIYGDGVILHVPQMADYEDWCSLRDQSRSFLVPWEPTWPSDDLTRSAFRRRLRRYWRDVREDQAYPFFVYRLDDETLLGGLTLSNIRRGVSQTCSLGYWIGERYARRGYMSAAVRSIIPFVFDNLRLHRLEAACLPSNDASINLLKGCGFTEEGYARGFLRINGVWQDHLSFAILSDDSRR